MNSILYYNEAEGLSLLPIPDNVNLSEIPNKIKFDMKELMPKINTKAEMVLKDKLDSDVSNIYEILFKTDAKIEAIVKNQELIKEEIDKIKLSLDKNYMKLKSKIHDCKIENTKHLELHYTINKELIENVIKEDCDKKIESYKEVNELRVNMLIDKVEELTSNIEIHLDNESQTNLLVDQSDLMSNLVKDVLDIKVLDIKNIKLQLDTLKSLVYESLPGINLIE